MRSTGSWLRTKSKGFAAFGRPRPGFRRGRDATYCSYASDAAPGQRRYAHPLFTAAFGQSRNQIVGVSPASTAAGASGLIVTLTLDTDNPPAAGAAFYGQDAQYRGNQPSYTLSDDGLTVTDNKTGLIWMRDADLDGDGDIDADDKPTYHEAQTYPDTLNAVSYGVIRFRLEDSDKVRFTLGNTGAPIPAADREKVFHRFYRWTRPGAAAPAVPGWDSAWPARSRVHTAATSFRKPAVEKWCFSP